MFNDYSIVLQKAPYWHAIWPISGAEKHHIAPRNGLFRTAKRALSESKTSDFGLCYGVYRKTIKHEMAFISLNLTFLHISFAKIFCQNLVKKNCKIITRVFVNTPVSGIRKSTKRYESDVQWRFSGRDNAGLSPRNNMSFHDLSPTHCINIFCHSVALNE